MVDRQAGSSRDQIEPSDTTAYGAEDPILAAFRNAIEVDADSDPSASAALPRGGFHRELGASEMDEKRVGLDGEAGKSIMQGENELENPIQAGLANPKMGDCIFDKPMM